jgi:hypothetical protein
LASSIIFKQHPVLLHHQYTAVRYSPFFLLLFIFLFSESYAQLPFSSTRQEDTVKTTGASSPQVISREVLKRPVTDSSWVAANAISPSSPSFSMEVMKRHPWFAFGKKAVVPEQPITRKVTGKEWLFYALVFLLLVFAILKRTFPKYFNDLFRLFFRTTLKHKQVREQLMQTPLPSLMLNGFFVASAAFYISFLVQYFKAGPTGNFWLLVVYAGAGLSVIYFLKFIGLKVSGWLFGMQEAADSYVFIVFIINKMIGITLIPFLFILAFSVGTVYMAGLTLSWFLVGGLLGYRLILTWGAVRNQVKVNLFHFFLYILAFEIAPLLLIYKGLLLFFSQTA